jgi:hypothetical protein
MKELFYFLLVQLILAQPFQREKERARMVVSSFRGAISWQQGNGMNVKKCGRMEKKGRLRESRMEAAGSKPREVGRK